MDCCTRHYRSMILFAKMCAKIWKKMNSKKVGGDEGGDFAEAMIMASRVPICLIHKLFKAHINKLILYNLRSRRFKMLWSMCNHEYNNFFSKLP